MGDVRYGEHYDKVRGAEDPAKALEQMPDDAVVAALAAASRAQEPYLANVLATEAMNRMQRNSTIVNLAGEALFALDVHGRVIHMNPAAEAQLGWRLEEVRGKLLHDLIHDRDAAGEPLPFENCPLRHAIKSGRTVRVEEDFFRRRDGVLYPVRFAGTPVRRDGEVVGVVVVSQDLSTQKEAQTRVATLHEKVREQATTLETILQSTPDLVFLLDRELRYHYVSRAAAKVMGLPVDAIIGRTWRELNISAETMERFARRVAEVLENGTTHRDTIVYSGPLGTRRYEYVMAPVPRDADTADRVVVTSRDVTERAQLLDALERSESTYRSLYENIPLMYFEATPEGTLRLANSYGAKQLGYTRGELEGKPIRALFHPEDRDRFDDKLAALVENEQEGDDWVARKVTKDLRVIWVHESMRILTDAQGERRVLIACKDITRERRAQQLLEGQARVLESIASGSPIKETLRELALVAEQNASGLYASILLYDPEMRALRHGAAPNLPESYNRAIDGTPVAPDAGCCGTTAYTKARVVSTDLQNDPRWEDYAGLVAQTGMSACWCTPILASDASVLGTFALYHAGHRRPDADDLQLMDMITHVARVAIEHDRDAARVRDAGSRIEGILESITDGFFAVGADWRFVYVNRQAERMLRRRREELLGQNVWEEFPEAWGSEFWKRYRRAREANEPAHFEEYYEPLGTWFEVHAYPSADGGLSVYFRDVTKRKTSEDALLRMNEELERRVRARTDELAQVNRDLETFSYSVSHDLRAPLRGISAMTEVLQEDYGKRLDEDGRRILSRLRDESERLSQQVHDLLEMARTVGGHLRTEPVDLSELARGVATSLQAADPARDVKFDIQDGMTAHGDPRLLRIVLENLFGNAWKFTQHTPGARIRFSAHVGDNGGTVFEVTDNGAGFDMAKAPALFRSFQRLHEVEEFPGTGVGLATVKRIVERHGGRVWAKGEVGRGATFYFTL